MEPAEAVTGAAAPAAGQPPPPRPRTSLARTARLLTDQRFRRVREAPSVAGRFLAVRALPAPDGCFRAGIVVSRRFSTRAVRRNRARRVLREALRQLYPAVGTGWFLFFPRQPLLRVKTPAVQAEMARLLAQLGYHRPPGAGPGAEAAP
jgi:ribonuclease P protein component